MHTCPSCGSNKRQVKNGQTRYGSQRYWCQGCGRKYTPEPKVHAYPSEVRAQAARMYSDGRSLRGIARHLGVAHQTVANWVTARTNASPDHPSTPACPVNGDEFVVLRKQAC